MSEKNPFANLGLGMMGNEQRYIYQGGPISDALKGMKSGLGIMAMDKMGVFSALDKMGMQRNENGTFSMKPSQSPSGAVPPITSGAAGNMSTNGVFGTNPMPISPPSFAQPAPSAQPTVSPVAPPSSIQPTTLPSMGAPTANPYDSGKKILDEEFHGYFPNSFNMTGMA